VSSEIETKVPALPALNGVSDPATRTFLMAVKELLEVRDGRRGKPLDRFVTLRELDTAGIASVKPSSLGGKLELLSGDGGLDYSTPPALTDFAVTGGYAQIFLSWAEPQYASFSYVEIWRSATDAIGTADLIGQTPAAVYSDSCGTQASFYYWVRAVNKAGVAGAYNAVAGVLGTTSDDITYIFEQLTGSLGDQPFYAITEPTVINGVTVTPGVYIKDARIANGTITNAKIQNAAIDSAKIADASIVTAKIGNAQITGAKIANATIGTANIGLAAITTATIADAAITNAKVTNAAITLAKIDTASITSLSALSATIGLFKSAQSGARLEIQDDVIKVFDANGVVRVKIGNLA
jgi:hypothetical protein